MYVSVYYIYIYTCYIKLCIYIYIRSKTAQARCAQEGSMDTKGKPITRMERTLKVSTKKGEKRYRMV